MLHSRFRHWVVQIAVLALAWAAPFAYAAHARTLTTALPPPPAFGNPDIADPIPIIPPTTEQESYDAWKHIYETLFESPWSAEKSAYHMLTKVSGPGRYAGVNDNNQPFTLTAYVADPIDYAALPGFDEETLAWAAAHSLEMTHVEANVATAKGAFDLFGSIVSWTDDNGNHNNQFLVGFYLSLLEQGRDEMERGRNSTIQEAQYSETWCFTIVFPCVIPTPECQACFDDYNDAVEEAQEDYEDAVERAERERQDDIDDANQAFQNCMDDAQNFFLICFGAAMATWAVAVAVCLATAGPFAPLCVLGAWAVRNIAIAACTANLIVSQNACERNRQQAYDRAQRDYEQAIEDANDALEDALEEAQQELEDCLNNNNCWGICSITICITIVYPNKGELQWEYR